MEAEQKAKAKARTFEEARENNSKPELEVLLKTKMKVFWDYQETLKKAQELEVELRAAKLKLELLSDRYPELLQVKGLADRMFSTSIFDIADDGDRIWVHAKDKEEAHEEIKRRKEHKRKEKERLQEAKKKKQKKTQETGTTE